MCLQGCTVIRSHIRKACTCTFTHFWEWSICRASRRVENTKPSERLEDTWAAGSKHHVTHYETTVCPLQTRCVSRLKMCWSQVCAASNHRIGQSVPSSCSHCCWGDKWIWWCLKCLSLCLDWSRSLLWDVQLSRKTSYTSRNHGGTPALILI